jgi:opacity protein-like surface antigen
MVRNLKVLGLAVMAMLAMTAVAASAAQAVEFHSEIENTTITGKTEAGSNSVFDAAGASISCTSGTFTGTQALKTSTNVTVTPAYSGCTFLSVLNVPVNMNGCQYTFDANGEVAVTGAACTAITFEATGCKVEVKKQAGLKEVTYTNIGSGTTREVTVTPHVIGITYTSSGLCPKNGTFSDGNYTSGNATVKGENSKGVQVGVWVE